MSITNHQYIIYWQEHVNDEPPIYHLLKESCQEELPIYHLPTESCQQWATNLSFTDGIMSTMSHQYIIYWHMLTMSHQFIIYWQEHVNNKAPFYHLLTESCQKEPSIYHLLRESSMTSHESLMYRRNHIYQTSPVSTFDVILQKTKKKKMLKEYHSTGKINPVTLS